MPNTRVFRVAVVQCSSVILDVDKTVAKLEKYAKEAADNGAKLVLFPEAFISCYPRGTNFGVIVGSRSMVHFHFIRLAYHWINARFPNKIAGWSRKVSKVLGVICGRSRTGRRSIEQNCRGK